jgi:hypothetical protein
MTAKEILQDLISTIEKNSTDNKATITNVDLWAKSWKEELKKVNNSALGDVINFLPSKKDVDEAARMEEGFKKDSSELEKRFSSGKYIGFRRGCTFVAERILLSSL